MSKCYLTFDAEFKWTTGKQPFLNRLHAPHVLLLTSSYENKITLLTFR